MHFHGKSSRREEVEWNVHVIRDKEKTKRRMEIKAEGGDGSVNLCAVRYILPFREAKCMCVHE